MSDLAIRLASFLEPANASTAENARSALHRIRLPFLPRTTHISADVRLTHVPSKAVTFTDSVLFANDLTRRVSTSAHPGFAHGAAAQHRSHDLGLGGTE